MDGCLSQSLSNWFELNPIDNNSLWKGPVLVQILRWMYLPEELKCPPALVVGQIKCRGVPIPVIRLTIAPGRVIYIKYNFRTYTVVYVGKHSVWLPNNLNIEYDPSDTFEGLRDVLPAKVFKPYLKGFDSWTTSFIKHFQVAEFLYKLIHAPSF